MLNYHVRQSFHNAGVPDDGEEVAVVWNYGSPTGVFSNGCHSSPEFGVTATETDDTARAMDFLVDEANLDGSHSQQCIAVTSAQQ